MLDDRLCNHPAVSDVTDRIIRELDPPQPVS